MPTPLTRRSALLGGIGALSLPIAARSEIIATARSLAQSSETGIVGMIPQGSEANLDAIIRDWTRDTGIGVTSRVVPVDDVNLSLTLGAMAGRTQPDFALPPTFNLQDLVTAGVIQSHDRIAQDLGESFAGLSGLYSAGDVVDGERYGIQTDGDVYVMFYRHDMRARHSARYEETFGEPLAQPTTWPELDRQMAFFHQPDQDRFGGAMFRKPGYLVWEFWSRLHAKGAMPFDRDLNPLLQSDQSVEALEQMILATAHLHPATATAGLFENWDLFKSTETYCNIGWGGSQKAFNAPGSPLLGKLSFGRLPGEIRDHSSYFNWGWSYVVPKSADRPDLGHLFAVYATSPDHSTPAIRAVDGYFDPFLPVHYDDPAIRAIYSEPFLTVHRAALSDCIPDLYLPGYGAFFASLSRAIEDALARRSSPRDALKGATEAWQIAVLDHDPAKLVARWRDLLGLYPAQFTNGL